MAANRGYHRGTDNPRHVGYHRRTDNPRHMGYHKLCELEQKTADDILNIVSNGRSGFSETLKLKDLKPDWIHLILKITKKACQHVNLPLSAQTMPTTSRGQVDRSHTPSALLMTLLNHIRTSRFLLQSLLLYLSSFCSEVDEAVVARFPQTVRDVLCLCRVFLYTMPDNVQQVMPLLSTLPMVINSLRTSNRLHLDQLDQEIGEVNQLCQDTMMDQRRRMEGTSGQAVGKKPRLQEDRPPPDNFRELSVFPTVIDLNQIEPYLPYNKVYGQYSSSEYYLDTHFRLLREDFMRPLRNGIRQYLASLGNDQKKSSIRIYQNIHIMHPICTIDGVVYRVSFDVARLHGVRWEHTKRLIYGSLICLSPDSFTTVYFGTVAQRDPELLKQGLVDLRFQGGTDEVINLGTQTKLVMAESSAYFESYKHVLEGLKMIQADDLPFARYLVRCERNIARPRYLQDDPRYDLRALVGDNNNEEEDMQVETDDDMSDDGVPNEQTDCLRKIDVLDKRSWPGAEKLELDPSQSEALQLALTKELAIIQGPPGTGKTYIGLKIVQALLKNSKYWNDNMDGKSPILLVCYTNHALDQFLEGICKFLRQGIVRVGGRSKSALLERFLLKELRKTLRQNKDVPLEVHRNRMDAMEEMDRVDIEVQRKVAELSISKQGLMSVDSLQDFIKTEQFDQLVNDRKIRDRNRAFSVWLGLDDGSALKMYDALEVKEREEVSGPSDSGRIDPTDIQAEDAEVDADDLQQQRELHGLDDERFSDESRRQKAILKKAFEQLAVRFSELDFGIRRQNKQPVPDEVAQRQQKLTELVRWNNAMTQDEAKGVRDIWRLSLPERWRLYRYWLARYRRTTETDMRKHEYTYELAARRLQEVRQQEDREILRRATLIAMTTSGAARYRDILWQIRPKIIIVEEAAEVLEAHIVSSLSPECQHMILIGDHKQLRPNPTDYKIAEIYKLKISMFERLVTNGLPHVTLKLQHRMAPNIAKLMHHVYDQLEDHFSVFDQGDVRGATNNLFFLDHDKFETQNEDLQSKINKHEANFVVAFARHLCLQGYGPSSITILTPYTGQLLQIRGGLRASGLAKIRACAIDNYQGEENEIVIVSLVRSNADSEIGFIGTNNRICVALSRAKRGLFLIGNAVLLGQRSELWSKVIQTMKADGVFGRQLPLFCVNHPETRMEMASAKDFDKSPEGGCMKPCESRLPCGHVCPRVCHAYDTDHSSKCRKDCARVCPAGHRCKKKCYEECGKCTVTKPMMLPKCGHTQVIPCHEHIATFICQTACEVRLSCGHLCANKCGEPHTEICSRPRLRTLYCGHKKRTECSTTPSTKECDEKCKEALACLHPCAGTCGTCLEGRLHKPCQAPCNRNLVCGHLCKAPCTRNCPPCTEKCQNRCPHSICQKSCSEACIPCVEPCAWRCKHHQCTRRCSDPCNRPRCNKPCRLSLRCGHQCIGLCGEPCPNKCRVCDRDEVQIIMFGNEEDDDARFVQLEDCGHIFEVEGMDKYMEGSTGSDNIQLKVCPFCRIPIRQNLRYGAILNKVLSDIETVKRMVVGERVESRQLLRRLNPQLVQIDTGRRVKFESRLDKGNENLLTNEEAACMENCVRFMVATVKVEKELRTLVNSNKYREINHSFKLFIDWLQEERKRLSEQELKEARAELERLSLLVAFTSIKKRQDELKMELPAVVDRQFQVQFEVLLSGKPLTEEQVEQVRNVLKEVERIVPRSGLGVSDAERIQIVQAMGLAQGKWFKCPNGHIYAIGDCGGATVESTCPECHARIGGTGHRLRSDNQLAPEMDGARHAAWSDAANMGNFDPQDLLLL